MAKSSQNSSPSKSSKKHQKKGSQKAWKNSLGKKIWDALAGPPLLESWLFLILAVVVDVVLLFILWLNFEFQRSHFVIGHALFFSIVTFIFFGFDKFLAVNEKRRVAERNLLGLSFLGGAVGGLLGIIVFRHKTRSLWFRFLIPIAAIINACYVISIILGGE